MAVEGPPSTEASTTVLKAHLSLAWLLAVKPWIIPIPGTKQLSHLEENLASAGIELTPEDLKFIEEGYFEGSVEGGRAPEDLLALTDVGEKLGTRSLLLSELS